MTMIMDGLESGEINDETVIIESSSGNLGIGLAQICASLGLRFIAVVDGRCSPSVIKMLTAYGATIEKVDEIVPGTNSLVESRLKRVAELLLQHPNSYWPNQYSNLMNPYSHRQTMDEIVASLGSVDYVFVAASTFGTLRGCAEYADEKGLDTKFIGVDAYGSVLSGGKPGRRLLPGHGSSIEPCLLRRDVVNEWVRVSEADCVVGCRRLCLREGLFLGASSGGVLSAIKKHRLKIEPDANCVPCSAIGETDIWTLYMTMHGCERIAVKCVLMGVW